MPEMYEWKKREEMKKKHMDALSKMLPNNSILKSVSEEEQEKMRMEKMEKRGDWSIVHDLVWAAEKSCREDGCDFDKTMGDLIDALKMHRQMCKDAKKPEEVKAIGY